jgi:hypothetical protein
MGFSSLPSKPTLMVQSLALVGAFAAANLAAYREQRGNTRLLTLLDACVPCLGLFACGCACACACVCGCVCVLMSCFCSCFPCVFTVWLIHAQHAGCPGCAAPRCQHTLQRRRAAQRHSRRTRGLCCCVAAAGRGAVLLACAGPRVRRRRCGALRRPGCDAGDRGGHCLSLCLLKA